MTEPLVSSSAVSLHPAVRAALVEELNRIVGPLVRAEVARAMHPLTVSIASAERQIDASLEALVATLTRHFGDFSRLGLRVAQLETRMSISVADGGRDQPENGSHVDSS